MPAQAPKPVACVRPVTVALAAPAAKAGPPLEPAGAPRLLPLGLPVEPRESLPAPDVGYLVGNHAAVSVPHSVHIPARFTRNRGTSWRAPAQGAGPADADRHPLQPPAQGVL